MKKPQDMSKAWAAYVRQNRLDKRMSKREVGYAAGIDPSYITHVERDGTIPRRDKVIQIAEALKVDTDECLLMAGFAPVSLPPKFVFELVQQGRMVDRIRTQREAMRA